MWFVCLVVVFMLVFLSPSPIVRAEDRVQDLGWLEWTWSYDNFARWQSGGYGASAQGRTMCWNRYLPSKAPLNLEVHLKLYHQGECVAKDALTLRVLSSRNLGRDHDKAITAR